MTKKLQVGTLEIAQSISFSVLNYVTSLTLHKNICLLIGLSPPVLDIMEIFSKLNLKTFTLSEPKFSKTLHAKRSINIKWWEIAAMKSYCKNTGSILSGNGIWILIKYFIINILSHAFFRGPYHIIFYTLTSWPTWYYII